MVSGDLSGIRNTSRCYDDQSVPDCDTGRTRLNICRYFTDSQEFLEHSLVAKLHTSLRADRTRRGASSSDEPREFFISINMTRKNRQHRPRITSPTLRTQMIVISKTVAVDWSDIYLCAHLASGILWKV